MDSWLAPNNKVALFSVSITSRNISCVCVFDIFSKGCFEFCEFLYVILNRLLLVVVFVLVK